MRATPPRQARSAARVERLLDAAADLVAAHGPEGFAFREVAARAGAAHGSLYQFFPTRAAILAALHDRYAAEALARARALHASFANAEPDAETLAEALVARFAPFYAEAPAYRALRRWPRAEDAEDRLDALIAAELGPLVRRVRPDVAPDRAEQIARATIEIADALLPLCEAAPHWERDARRALAGYLSAA